MASHYPLRVPTDSVIIPSPSQSEEKGTENDTGSSAVAREILAGGDHSYAVRRAMVPATAQRSSVTGGVGIFYPHPECLALWAWSVSGKYECGWSAR